ncbi:Oleosin [Dillenia turbinata]|uniref:Oleosin n=1 Tax=Dillenia turbinata TaxID=194707 RepID=A0AAN8VCN8_9MAGN
MTDRQRPTRPTTTPNGGATTGAAGLLRKLQHHAPNSSQLIGFVTLVISGTILLFLTGLTVTISVLGLVILAPLIVLSSPIWIPAGAVLFFFVAAFVSVFGFGVAAVAGSAWMYKYFRGFNPPGSDRFEYARGRIADTASQVKGYAREYRGYLQGKVKDAAPGA